MQNVQVKQNGSNYELWLNGQRVSTGTQSYINSLAQSYGAPQSSSTPSATSPTPAPQPTSGGSGALTPVPDAIYQAYSQAVANGTMSPQQALNTINSFVGKLYSSGADPSKLFPSGQTFTKSDGSQVKFDNSGSGTLIKTTPTVTTTTVSPSGISTTTGSPSGNTTGGLQYGAIGAAVEAAGAAAGLGKTTLSFADALRQAQQDPTISAKYSDALRLDTASFHTALSTIQTQVSTDAENKRTQFENDRRQLAESSAAAGQAYSGFRNRAQQELGAQESGIVTSSRAQLQRQLQDATSSFEARYGTGATSPATASFLSPFAASGVSLSGLATTPITTPETVSGSLAGGITGSTEPAKQADIRQKALDLVNLSAFPSTT